MTRATKAGAALNDHMSRHRGHLLESDTHAGDEFDRLYLVWIRARWDEGDVWVRSVWMARP